MASFEDEQAEEIEVLQSIFPVELEILSPAPKSFKIHLTPNSTPATAEENHVAVALICTFPPDYPSVVPIFDIEIEKGLGKKHVEELKSLAELCAQENLGAPSIFSVTEVLKTWLMDNNIPGQDGSMYADMMRRMQQKDVDSKRKAEKAAIMEAADSENKVKVEDPEEQERIRRRQAGTVVTLESFNEWKLKFEAEMRDRALAAVGGRVELLKDPMEERLTGKQLFMLNKAGHEEELLIAGEQEEIVEPGTEEITAGLKSTGLDDEEDDEDDEDYVDGEDDDDIDGEEEGDS